MILSKKYNFSKVIGFVTIYFVWCMWGKLWCQDFSYSWDFSDCNITDILYAVSLDTGISICPDDTVEGKGDFKFTGNNFNDAFNSFLKSSRLYVEKKDNLWIVSKFLLTSSNNKYSLDVYDLYPFEIIEKVCEKVHWIITYDSLPSTKMSIHFKDLDKEQLLKNLGKYFGNYQVIINDSGFHLMKDVKTNDFVGESGSVDIEIGNDSSFKINIKNGSFFDVIEKLFAEAENRGEHVNYCILSNRDCNVERAVFEGENIYDTVEKLCMQNGYKVIVSEDVLYITVDNSGKSSLLSEKRSWNKFSLKYICNDEIIPLLKLKLGNIEIISLIDKSSFLCNSTEIEKKEIGEFIKEIDVKKNVYLINLKYLKPSELMEYLPPDINKDSLFIADNHSGVYFRGTDEAYSYIMEQIKIIDKPVKRISYDLLILQYDDTKQNSWASSIGVKSLKMGDRTSVSGMLGSVMGFNLNVVGAYGLNFATELQASIEENRTRVYADTTLHGVSGKKISFQNTNTYRYRDNNLNPETGEPIYSGVTREIITGIKLDVLGWISGDGMITSTVTASISRQGIDTSGSTGNPPPTSEKIVTTEVNGKSGEPVVLSGLILSSSNEWEKRSPGISKIPIIGNLFKSKNQNTENSQMIIYLVPHVENENINLQENINWEEIVNDKFKKLTEFVVENKKI